MNMMMNTMTIDVDKENEGGGGYVEDYVAWPQKWKDSPQILRKLLKIVRSGSAWNLQSLVDLR